MFEAHRVLAHLTAEVFAVVPHHIDDHRFAAGLDDTRHLGQRRPRVIQVRQHEHHHRSVTFAVVDRQGLDVALP